MFSHGDHGVGNNSEKLVLQQISYSTDDLMQKQPTDPGEQRKETAAQRMADPIRERLPSLYLKGTSLSICFVPYFYPKEHNVIKPTLNLNKKNTIS